MKELPANSFPTEIKFAWKAKLPIEGKYASFIWKSNFQGPTIRQKGPRDWNSIVVSNCSPLHLAWEPNVKFENEIRQNPNKYWSISRSIFYFDFLFIDLLCCFFTDTCSVIDPTKRVDCGWPGISEDRCVQMGCCFDSSIEGARFCFYKAGKVLLSEVTGTCLLSKFSTTANLWTEEPIRCGRFRERCNTTPVLVNFE